MTARRAAVLAAASVPSAIFVSDVLGGPAAPVAVIFLGAAIGWRYIPGFWRTVLRGALAGGLAGLLLLGPGYRMAMRIVAILEETRTPEFSLGGTVFLVVGIGLIFGATISAGLGVVLRTFDASRWVAVGALSAVTFGVLFADSEVMSELTDLGLGAFFNVPMFFGVTVAWAWLADRWARPGRDSVSSDAELVTVP